MLAAGIQILAAVFKFHRNMFIFPLHHQHTLSKQKKYILEQLAMPPPTTPSPLPPTNTNSQASSSLSPPSTQSRLAQNTISYILFPKKGALKDETDGFRQILDSVVGDPSKVFCSSVGEQVIFWAAPLSPDQAQECASYNLVR